MFNLLKSASSQQFGDKLPKHVMCNRSGNHMLYRLLLSYSQLLARVCINELDPARPTEIE